MSKITKALEKAARERLQKRQELPTVASTPVTVPLAVAPAAGSALGTEPLPIERQAQVDPHIVSATDPKSPIAEQYRILRTNLQALRLRAGSKTIVVTSSVHNEGKSVTAINLALTLARQEQMRVVLVDADLRKPTVHTWLGLSERPQGLSTVLANGGELNGELVRLASPSLSVLPAGPTPDHPAEMFESAAMRRLLNTLKSQFDIIILDAPPVLPVADPSILSGLADGVLLVVRAGKTQRRVVLQAQRLLQQAKANLVGCVLTHVEYYLPGYYRYYQYRYGTKEGNGRAERIVPPVTPAAEPTVSP